MGYAPSPQHSYPEAAQPSQPNPVCQYSLSALVRTYPFPTLTVILQGIHEGRFTGMYEAIRLLLESTFGNAKLALCLLNLGQHHHGFEMATKTNAVNRRADAEQYKLRLFGKSKSCSVFSRVVLFLGVCFSSWCCRELLHNVGGVEELQHAQHDFKCVLLLRADTFGSISFSCEIRGRQKNQNSHDNRRPTQEASSKSNTYVKWSTCTGQ